jgi:outer membrane receptor protein involved in Fe transport
MYKKLPFIQTIFVLILLLTASSYALAQNGIIQGKVVDQETGEPLSRASILIEGTKLGAYSDVKGSFRITKVPAGKYAVRVTYIGYQTKKVQNVVVNADKTTKLDISLPLEKKSTEEVVVTAQRSYDNSAANLNRRKNASQVSDGVSQEEIGKLPDSDAGQALKRVSGVTLVGGKFLYVRGVSERYNNTTLNGAGLTSTEPDKKSFSFDMFPSEFLQNANVIKSFTPDLPGNFVGGLVQLSTIDFPEAFQLKVSVGSSVNSNVNFLDNAFVHSNRGANDWLGRDDGTRALPDLFPKDREELNDLRRRANNQFDTTGAKETYEAASRSLNSANWQQNRSTIGLFDNRSMGISYTDLFNIGETEQIGLIAAVNYGNTFSINNIDRNGIFSNKDPFFFTRGSQSNRSVNISGMLNTAIKFGGSNVISFKNVYNISSDDEYVILEGQDVGYQFLDLKQISTQFVQKTMYSGTVSGEHSLPFSDVNLDWRAGYSTSERDEPDFRRLRYSRQTADSSVPLTADIFPTQQGDGTKAGRFFSNLVDDALSGALNIVVPLSADAKIKVGGLYEERKRTFKARSLTIIESQQGLDQDIYASKENLTNPDSIFAEKNFRYDDGFLMSEDSKLSDAYDASEVLTAAYLMADLPFNLFGLEFRTIVGARIENNVQKLNSFDISNAPIEVNRPFTDVLPSLNFVWKVDNNSNLRASASQTLTRPSLREFAPFAFYDFQMQALQQGNPTLIRTLIQNYDLRYEYFPNPGEVISVSLFYKNFQNAIEETIFPQQSELTRTFANASNDAQNYGVELEFRKGLGFINSSFETVLFSVNYAYIQSQIEVLQGTVTDTRTMWGQSPYSLNIGLSYLQPEWLTNFNVAYNRYGKRIVQVAQQGIYQFEDPHVYEMPRDVIDISISQPLFDNSYEVKFAIRDLLNQQLVWLQGGETIATNLRGTNYSLSMSYRIR